MENPYAVLGVERDADDADLHRAYRRQVQRWHPDRHRGSREAHDRFLAIKAAFVLLSDPSRRAAWDDAAEQHARADARDVPFEVGGTWPQWTERWKEWWAPPTPAIPLGPPGDDATVTLKVDLSVVASGPSRHRVRAYVAGICPRCAGDGGRSCSSCGGTGQVLRWRAWDVVVPQGTPDGAVIRLRGAGHAGPRFGTPGSIRIVVRWQRAGIWRWNGGRVEGRLSIPAGRARAGGRVQLRLPRGQVGWITLSREVVDGAWVTVPHAGFDEGGRPGSAWLRVSIRRSLWKRR